MNQSEGKGGENEEKPITILIGTEGKETEPQYFNIVIGRKRIRQRANVMVVGRLGQHKQLVDEIVKLRAVKAADFRISEEDVECWAVCDKDTMECSFAELEQYASSSNVRIAFSNPCFEIFLLQHLTRSSSNLNAKQLAARITAELRIINSKMKYDKANLSWFDVLVDTDPGILDRAIANSNYIEDVSSTPYVTVHKLLQRLLEMAA